MVLYFFGGSSGARCHNARIFSARRAFACELILCSVVPLPLKFASQYFRVPQIMLGSRSPFVLRKKIPPIRGGEFFWWVIGGSNPGHFAIELRTNAAKLALQYEGEMKITSEARLRGTRKSKWNKKPTT